MSEITEDMVLRGTKAVLMLRAAEVGGCYRPDDAPEEVDDCVEGQCYCVKQAMVETRAVLDAALNRKQV